MRFFPIALYALTCGYASASGKVLTGNDLNAMLERGEIDQDLLIKHAKPLNRHLQNNNGYGNGYYSYRWNDGSGYNMYGNNNQNYNGYNNGYYYDDGNGNNNNEKKQNYVQNPFDGNLSIRFNTCMSFKVEDPDLLNDDTLLTYAKDGTIVAQESYVLFDIQQCLPGNCVFEENNMNMVYMVPLPIFLESMIYYYPNRREEYCEACQNFYDYCTAGDGIYYDTAVYANGGKYCYQGEHYELIDCHKCRSFSCYTGNDYYWEEENIENWFDQITQCQATGTTWKSYDLYGGLMCNQDGSGVEFGVFADENCRYYHTGKNYQKVMSQYDFYYYGKAPEAVEFMFTNSISCMSSENKNYISAYTAVYGTEECQENDLLNTNCEYLLAQKYTRPLGSCENPNYSSSSTSNKSYNVDDSDYNSRDWMRNGPYTPQITYEDQHDPEAVCKVVKQTYKYSDLHSNVYDEGSSGRMFAYDEAEDDMDKKRRHVSLFDVFGYIVLSAVVLAIAFMGVRRYKKSKDRQELAFATDKDLPLVT